MRFNLFYTYGSTAFLMAINVILMLIINKYSSVEIYGQLTLMLATVGMLINFISFRTGEAVTRFLIENDNECKSSAIVAFGFLFDLLIGICILALIFIFQSTISSLFFNDIDVSLPTKYIIYTLLFNLLGGSVIGRYTSDKNFKKIAIFRMIDPLIKISSVVILVRLGSLNILNITLIYFYSSMAKLLIMWGVYFIDGYSLSFNYIDSLYIKRYITYTAKTFASTTLKSFNENADVIILGAFMGSYTVGVYQSLKVVTQPIRFIINPLSSVRFPYYVSIIFSGGLKKVTFEIINISIILSIFSSILFIIIYMYKQQVLSFISVDLNVTSKYILLYHYILTIGLCFIDWWFRLISLSTDPKYSIYSNLISASLIWSFVLFCIKFYGLDGFLISMIFVLMIRGIFHYYILHSLNNNRVKYEADER